METSEQHVQPEASASSIGELLKREPISVDTELREYYATMKLTPWRDTNFGALRNRSR